VPARRRQLWQSRLARLATGLGQGSLSGTSGGLIGAARYLLLTRSDPIDALPYLVEGHCIELLLIERRGGWRDHHVGDFLRS
jgi:hypothetical protein